LPTPAVLPERFSPATDTPRLFFGQNLHCLFHLGFKTVGS